MHAYTAEMKSAGQKHAVAINALSPARQAGVFKIKMLLWRTVIKLVIRSSSLCKAYFQKGSFTARVGIRAVQKGQQAGGCIR